MMWFVHLSITSSKWSLSEPQMINPWRMREGYGSHSVCTVCLCVSVAALAATYLVYKSRVRCYKVLYGVSNVCIVWILLKTFRSPVLAFSCCLHDEFLMDRMNSRDGPLTALNGACASLHVKAVRESPLFSPSRGRNSTKNMRRETPGISTNSLSFRKC